MTGNPYNRHDPQDLGDLESILRRLDSRLASAAQPAVVPVQPPANGLMHSVENTQVRLLTALGAGVSVAVATWMIAGAVFGAKQEQANVNNNFIQSERRINARIDALAERIKESSDTFYDRTLMMFSDFCRRTEKQNPNWRCADPIAVPLAGRTVRKTAPDEQ
jgi:hypothetical protein